MVKPATSGRNPSDARPVEWMVNELANLWGSAARWEQEKGAQPHEAQSLTLECSKAANRLRWRPSLHLKDSLTMTAAWYRARLHGNDMHAFTLGQIHSMSSVHHPTRRPYWKAVRLPCEQ